MHPYGWCSVAFLGVFSCLWENPRILALQNLQMYTPARGNTDLSQGKWRNLTWDVGLPERKMPAPSRVRASVSSRRQTQPYCDTGFPNSGGFCCWSCILLWRWCCVHHSPGWDPGSSWEPLLFPLGEAGGPTSLFLTVWAARLSPSWDGRTGWLLVFPWDGAHSLPEALHLHPPGSDPGGSLPHVPFSLSSLGSFLVYPYLKFKEGW